jgi:hypothetical protein
MACLQRADLLSATDELPSRHRGQHRLVRAAQPVRMIDRHDRLSGHHAGERHDPIPGGQHRLADPTAEVDAPVPGSVRVRRRLEPPRHGRETGKRPPETRPRRHGLTHGDATAGRRRHSSRRHRRHTAGDHRADQESHL